ncbi:MAG TPA: methyltransferase domain-containing protein [Candidatus Saccharimonadales bacterium]
MEKPNLPPTASGGYNYPTTPRQQVIELIDLLETPSDILDIGAGFGNNCIPLLEAGHTVTATETNEDCIAYLNELKAQYPNRLNVVEAPIQALPAAPDYDAVICTMVLHFLTNNEAAHAISAMQHVTRKGGYNVITTYLASQEIGSEYTWLIDPQKLPEYYKDWTTVSYEESYPFTLDRVKTTRQLARWLLGKKGYKSARLITRR